MDEMLIFFQTYFNYFLMSVAGFSLLMGSFINVIVHRLPRILEFEWSQECREYLGLKSTPEKSKLGISLPFSHCPSCNTTLKPWHNIPLISYLVLRGKCAFCHVSISLRYPLIELLTCCTSVFLAYQYGVSWMTLASLGFSWILIALTFIDIDCQLLPDELTFLLLGLGLFSSLFSLFCTPEDAILGTIIGYLLFAILQWGFFLVTGKIGMGQGDYKLLAALGGFLGWQLLPIIILIASISGLIGGVMHMTIKREFKSVPLPFGPYLALAGWVSLIWGREIMLYYHQFFLVN